jgi:hypothetical protein
MRALGFFLLMSTLACSRSNELPAPVTFPSDSATSTPGTVCEGYYTIALRGDRQGSPCLLVEGLVFQRYCDRIGFLNCTFWEYAIDYEGQSYINYSPYHCAVDNGGGVQISWLGAEHTLDLETGSLSTFDLVGTDLGENFDAWFPELADHYEQLAPGYPPTSEGVCI